MELQFIVLISGGEFLRFIISGIFAGIGFAISFVTCYFLVPIISNWMKKRNIVGIDVHKKDKPKIPERGGLSILISVLVAASILTIIYMFVDIILFSQLLVFLVSILLAGIIGYLDDAIDLGTLKPFLLILPCLPIIGGQFIFAQLFNPGTVNLLNIVGDPILPIFNPQPVIPLVGRFSIYTLYFVLVILVFPILCNGVNMLDVYNGSMSGTMSINFGVILIGAIFFVLFGLSSPVGILLSAIMFGSTLAFFRFNKYPARVFSGNVGSITIGAGMALIAMEGGVEAICLIVLVPYIINGFQMLASIGRLIEGKKIKARPVILLKDGRIKANPDPKAPLTLTRIVLAGGPMTEKEIVKSFLYLTFFCAILAIITAILCNPIFVL